MHEFRAFTPQQEDILSKGADIVSLANAYVHPRLIADLKHGDGYATLLVTDCRILWQYNWILGVVNDHQQCFTAHIVTDMTSNDAYTFLDDSFHSYVDGCCYELGCDATVEYVVDGQVVMAKEYGWEDGSYSMAFRVYCKPDVEDLLATQLGNASRDSPLIVVSPDTSDWGFAVHRSDGSDNALQDAHDFLHNR